MKRFFIVCLFIFVLTISVFAEGEDLIESDPVVFDQPVNQTIVYADVSKDPDYELVGIEVRSVSPVDPEDVTGLKSALLSVLGSYDPIIVEYQYSNQQGYYSYLREVQYDWVWLASATFLLVFIYCLFRLGGALLDR